jgi:hypothetical protein
MSLKQNLNPSAGELRHCSFLPLPLTYYPVFPVLQPGGFPSVLVPVSAGPLPGALVFQMCMADSCPCNPVNLFQGPTLVCFLLSYPTTMLYFLLHLTSTQMIFGSKLIYWLSVLPARLEGGQWQQALLSAWHLVDAWLIYVLQIAKRPTTCTSYCVIQLLWVVDLWHWIMSDL